VGTEELRQHASDRGGVRGGWKNTGKRKKKKVAKEGSPSSKLKK